MMMNCIIALIPARAGSKRIPGKNMKLLSGKPLIQWTIEAAQQSGIFTAITVSTEDETIGQWSEAHGAIWYRRPPSFAEDHSPDIEWVRHAVTAMRTDADALAILRPTSPFRTSEFIISAWRKFLAAQPADSLRAVRRVAEHPGKMWMAQRDGKLLPLLPYWTRTGMSERDAPWHSAPTQTLPAVYVQTASLEIAWINTIIKTETIAGSTVVPFVTNGWDGFDINTPDDWARAEAHAAEILAVGSVSALSQIH